MIRATVAGAAGRMGGHLVKLIAQTDGIELVGALERPGHVSVGQDAGEVAGIGSLGVPISERLDACLDAADVVVDFTSPAASMAHLDAVCRVNKAIVIGTTGFREAQRAEIQSRARQGRVFLAPNMSVGVNVLLKVVGHVARLLGDTYDVEIVEAHHRFKKDAPSGTALALAESVAKALGRNVAADAVHGRQGAIGERSANEIGIHAVRAGDVVGDHTVIFGGLGERIEIAHKATSRETFARGALRAALWLPSQPNGFYTMMDLLGLS